MKQYENKTWKDPISIPDEIKKAMTMRGDLLTPTKSYSLWCGKMRFTNGLTTLTHVLFENHHTIQGITLEISWVYRSEVQVVGNAGLVLFPFTFKDLEGKLPLVNHSLACHDSLPKNSNRHIDQMGGMNQESGK